VERREQILAVAARHFEQRPYSGVSTGAIASEAGVGRPLINYYFGTKRELYLQVIRRFAMVPPDVPAAVVRGLEDDSLEARIRASLEYWLSLMSRHQSMWTSAISVEAFGQDPEIALIFEHADEVAATRMLEALGLATHPKRDRLHTLVQAYGGLAKAACRQWLVHGALTRSEVSVLLTQTLLTILEDVVERIGP
jgi:AcrR family transcriptional regulator